MSSGPPDLPTLFIDRSLGKHVVGAAIRAVHRKVLLHDDVFRQDEPDDLWLARAGAENWIVLTRDKRIRYNPAERKAIIDCNARVFVFTGGNVTGTRMGEILSRAVPTILTYSEEHRGPFLVLIDRSGGLLALALSRSTRTGNPPARRGPSGSRGRKS